MNRITSYLLVCLLMSSSYSYTASTPQQTRTCNISGRTVAITTVAAVALCCGGLHLASKSKNDKVKKTYRNMSKWYESIKLKLAEKYYEFQYWLEELFKKQEESQGLE